MKFLDEHLIVEPLDDGIHWRVMAPFCYAVGAPDGATKIEVPAGYITDFASTPRLLWTLLRMHWKSGP